jgi:DNA-binding response OmpR family regulator
MSDQRIAVVDGSNDVSIGLARLFSAQGYDAYWVDGTMDAAAYVLEHGADVVVLGIALLGVSGYDVAKALRAGGFRGRLIALAEAVGVEPHSVSAWFDESWQKPLKPAEIFRFAGLPLGHPLLSFDPMPSPIFSRDTA